MDPLNLSDRDCRIAKRQLAVGNQAARIATNLGVPLKTVMADLEAMGIIPERRSPRVACGTDRGYHRHKRQQEPACDACRNAHTDTEIRRRHRKGAQTA